MEIQEDYMEVHEEAVHIVIILRDLFFAKAFCTPSLMKCIHHFFENIFLKSFFKYKFYILKNTFQKYFRKHFSII